MSFKQILNTRHLLNNQLREQDWPNLQKFIQHLQSYMNQCIKNRQYIEAQKSKDKIIELQKQIKKRSLSQIQNKLDLSLKQLDIKQSQQIKIFQIEWQNRQNKIIQEFNVLLKKKSDKQNEQKQRYLNQLQTALPQQPSPDTQMHKLKWVQDQCVKQGNFLQAQKAKQRMQARQSSLIQKHKKLRENNISLMMSQIEQKHMNQLVLIQNRLKQKLLENQNQNKKKRKDLDMKHAKEIKEVRWIFNQEMKKNGGGV